MGSGVYKFTKFSNYMFYNHYSTYQLKIEFYT